MSGLRTTTVKLLLYLAKQVSMGNRTVTKNDTEYGIQLALTSAYNPMTCCCMTCIMGKGDCLYEVETKQEQDAYAQFPES